MREGGKRKEREREERRESERENACTCKKARETM